MDRWIDRQIVRGCATKSGRIVIVGVAEDETQMLDASIKPEMLRNTVEFSSADSDEWVRDETAKVPA